VGTSKGKGQKQRTDNVHTGRTLERQCHRLSGSVVVITCDSVGRFGVLFVEQF
jgi:hypothetical protein